MMITVLIAAAVAAAPQPTPHQEAAYIAGRCSVWFKPQLRAEIEASMAAIDPRLFAWFHKGEADNVDGIRADVCADALRTAKMKVDAYERERAR